MNTHDLLEADFSQHAASALNKFGAAAGGAYSKLKAAHGAAHAEIKGDIAKAQTAAEKAAEKNKSIKQKQLGTQIPQLVAQMVLDRTPEDADSIEELHALNAEQFNDVYAAIEKAKERITKFPREMRKALKSSDFLQAQDKTEAELNSMLSVQPEKGIEKAEDMLMKNIYTEQTAWKEVLVSDDQGEAARNMVSLIKTISRDFAKRNLAATGTNKPRGLPEGTGIVRIMSTQRQLITIRLGLLSTAVDQLASKPVTEAALRRVRKLLERMM